MSALIDDMPRQYPHHFQIIIRLQLVRAKVCDLARCDLSREHLALAELQSSCQSVSTAAREAGLQALMAVSQEVSARLAVALRTAQITEAMLGLIGDWAANAELYLRRPHFRGFARTLVLQLNDPAWGAVMEGAAQMRLLHELTGSWP